MSENDSPWAHPACCLFMGPGNTIDDLTIFYGYLGKEQSWYSYQKLCGPKSPQSCSRLISFQSWFLPNCLFWKLAQIHFKRKQILNSLILGLPWWSPGYDSMLPMQRPWVWSLVGELDPTCCNQQEFLCCSKDKKFHMPQLRPTAVKQINKIKINI